MDARFEDMAARYIEEFPALYHVSATGFGDHRHDTALDEVGPAARERSAAFIKHYLAELDAFDPAQLSRANQVDYASMNQRLLGQRWRLEQFPRLFTQIRETLVPALVPKIHTETAIRQSHGVEDRNHKRGFSQVR